jgi:hypothetical protein
MNIIYKCARCVTIALADLVIDDEEATALQAYNHCYETFKIAEGTIPNMSEVPPCMSSHPALLRLVEKIVRGDWFERASCWHEIRMGRGHVFLMRC